MSSSKQESAQTEERIAAILNEAQAAMALRQSQERVRHGLICQITHTFVYCYMQLLSYVG